jgi:RimJ/RimL family protein N-acetyltransferase
MRGQSMSARHYWQGNHVRLRAIEPSDWEVFFQWNLDTEMARALYWVPFPRSKEAMKRWAEKESTQEPERDHFFWVIEDLEGQVVGSIGSNDCDPRNGTFKYGVAIMKEHHRKGYAMEAITLVLLYFFEELRYQKVNAGVYSFNRPSIQLHEKMGFQREGHLRRMAYTRGEHFDVIIFGMTVEEFRERYPGNR